MPLITIVLVLIVIGVLLWLVETYLPLDPMIKRIIQILVIVVVVVWILQVTGLWQLASTVTVGHVGR
jgi:hypothetical protein